MPAGARRGLLRQLPESRWLHGDGVQGEEEAASGCDGARLRRDVRLRVASHDRRRAGLGSRRAGKFGAANLGPQSSGDAWWNLRMAPDARSGLRGRSDLTMEGATGRNAREWIYAAEAPDRDCRSWHDVGEPARDLNARRKIGRGGATFGAE